MHFVCVNFFLSQYKNLNKNSLYAAEQKNSLSVCANEKYSSKLFVSKSHQLTSDNPILLCVCVCVTSCRVTLE